MGKVEKVVVLSVLFLITLILVISLSGPAEDPAPAVARVPADAGGAQMLNRGPASPLEVPGATPAREQGRPLEASYSTYEADAVPAPTSTRRPDAVASRPDTLLSTTVGTAEPSGPAGTILVTQAGLLPGFDDYRLYAWRSGDTWRSIATRYFGDPTRVELLRRSNEGRGQVAPGTKILVPIFDLDMPADGDRRPPAVPQRTPASSDRYTVIDGDSLWKISKKVYGQGTRWKEIFEANRDVLPSQDDLSPGQELRIP